MPSLLSMKRRCSLFWGADDFWQLMPPEWVRSQPENCCCNSHLNPLSIMPAGTSIMRNSMKIAPRGISINIFKGWVEVGRAVGFYGKAT